MASSSSIKPPPTYVPFTFEKAPIPMDQITDPTPAEQRAIDLELKKQKQAEKDEVTRSVVEEKKSKGGLINKLSSVATNVSSQAEKLAKTAVVTGEVQMAKLVDEHASKRFTTAFPAMASSDKLMGDHSAKVLTQEAPFWFSGFLDITDSHICFVGDNKLNFSFPLSDVVSIQKAVTLQTEGEAPPYVLQVPHPTVIPSAITIYTRQLQKHVFCDVKSCKDALNVLDHNWRAVIGKPPVPGVDYEEA